MNIGESHNNIDGKIGGDSNLSLRGQEFARKLAEYVKDLSKAHPNLRVWTSWLTRSIDTGKLIPGVQERYVIFFNMSYRK